jgi:hypothetical protein
MILVPGLAFSKSTLVKTHVPGPSSMMESILEKSIQAIIALASRLELGVNEAFTPGCLICVFKKCMRDCRDIA